MERKLPKVKPVVEWKYRGVSSLVTGKRYFCSDKTYFNYNSLNIKNLLKGRVVYNNYIKELNDAGNTKVTTCQKKGLPMCCSLLVIIGMLLFQLLIDCKKVPSGATVRSLTCFNPRHRTFVQRYPKVPLHKLSQLFRFLY